MMNYGWIKLKDGHHKTTHPGPSGSLGVSRELRKASALGYAQNRLVLCRSAGSAMIGVWISLFAT